MGQSVRGGAVVGYRTITPYSGPGDAVPGALLWAGLRAYSSATIGSNAVRLRRDSDNGESDFVTISGGGLDVSAIAAFKGAANLFVRTLYDQTGNGRDLINTNTAQQPAFVLGAFGAFPAIAPSVAGATIKVLQTPANNFTQAQPFSMSLLANKTTGGTEQTAIFANSTNLVEVTGPGNNTITLFLGGPSGVATATDGAWHAHQFVSNDPSSIIVVDGVSTNFATGGGNGFVAEKVDIGNFGDAWIGFFFEMGIWSGAWNSAQYLAMNSNQHAFGGF